MGPLRLLITFYLQRCTFKCTSLCGPAIAGQACVFGMLCCPCCTFMRCCCKALPSKQLAFGRAPAHFGFVRGLDSCKERVEPPSVIGMPHSCSCFGGRYRCSGGCFAIVPGEALPCHCCIIPPVGLWLRLRWGVAEPLAAVGCIPSTKNLFVVCRQHQALEAAGLRRFQAVVELLLANPSISIGVYLLAGSRHVLLHARF
jgi:hypothetical protein